MRVRSRSSSRWRLHAERLRDGARRVELLEVPLPVVDAERVQREAVALRHCRRGIGIKAAAEKNDGSRPALSGVEGSRLPVPGQTPRVSGLQMYLCTCSCTRTSSRSAITHSDSCFGSRSPCTGENSTALTRAGKVLAPDDLLREFIVAPIGDHEFHLVPFREVREVAPVVLVRLAGARALHVHDADDARRHVGDAAMPAGLDQHGLPGIEQALHQRIHVGLQQWLAAGHLDGLAAARLDVRDDVVNAHLAALVEGVRRVAPAAAQVAGGQANEDARPARIGRLALDRMEDLVNR